MRLLVLNGAEVRRLLPMRECMRATAEALSALARGEAVNPLRGGMRKPDGSGVFERMRGLLGGSMGVHRTSLSAGPRGTEYESHQGVVVLLEAEHGSPIALLDASSVAAVRTAAASGVATTALARDDARVLALLGSGVQAAT